MSRKAIDITGKKFGRLTVIERSPQKREKDVMWICRCDCGKEVTIQGGNLRSGHSTSCGCFQRQSVGVRFKDVNTTHGKSYTPEWRIWIGIKQRCLNKKRREYPDYGGRGVKICDRWMSFDNFFLDMGKRPSKEHSIERENNDGDYEPLNCRWATRSEQNSNQRRSIKNKL